MMNLLHKSALPFMIAILLGLCSSAYGQKAKKIEVKYAESLIFDERTDAQRLIGKVLFEHEGTLLYCDSAYLYPDNRMDAFSNVRIISDSVTATGNFLNYDGNTRLGMLRGNVVMTDPNSRLVTEELLYDLANKSARYTTGGKIVSKSNTLESVFGQYASEKRMFYFKKKVKLENPKYTMVCDTLQYATISEIAYFLGPTTITSKDNEIYCEQGYYNTKTDQSEFIKNAKFSSSGQIIEADTLRYNQKTAEGTALRNISITDTTEKVVLRGNRAFYNEKTGKTLVTENAEMQRQFGKDTLFLHADTLRSVLDTTSKKRNLLAYHRAQFYKSDFQGRCDSLTFSENDSMMRLYRDPVIWNDDNQLTADTVRIQLANDQLDKLYLIKAGFISSQVDSLHFNQISGKKITGYFEKNDLDRVLVEGNGESIYFAEDDDNSYIGVNKAFCSHMMIYLDSSKIKSISFYQQPDATLFPVKDLSEEEMKLKGLLWLGQVRPASRYDIFTWKALPPRENAGRKRIKK